MSLVRLRTDVPREACLERWLGAHADLVRALPGIREYTVDVATDPRPVGSWDAIATLRFEDREALRRFECDPQLRQRLVATREDFAQAVEAFLVDEHRIISKGGV